MDQELKELYQQVILDHNKSPRNFREIDNATQHAEGYNPLCGDRLDVYLIVEEGIVKDVSFKGDGCAISKASASVMTSLLKGKKIDEVEKMFESFHDLVTGKLGESPDLDELGKLAVFAGVQEFPVRVKCASLAWHTMMNALHNNDEKVTTE
ncbi:MAG: SUF system NifU family Fe-S cluster assembly protein [Ignavibacteria bacterium]|nr:SUF system NifU family Fe-S cluster assembly protein [Ignavibacteria bacterium]MBT8382625.1 SUF system NifU family Fe-S cluster assembly protein [Ignavibacteria bacterium]MBT8390546.1 SUF system NifU family Fe-S cluster assembly protein [Ignavibacteria bacterium]NNJ52379.1 SUF system NifU family Fe-S cluster assembly protein [Ignavibacteriaceae bacterium]NNL19722.1 SUF system NifU family Fe-S cluster assembly protein [Ignavibacteriaceae bacterium]